MVSFTDGAQWTSETPKQQPVHLTLSITHDITLTAETDDLTHSIDYSSVCKTLVNVSGDGSYSSIESLRDRILSETFRRHADVQHVCVQITRPRALLHPASTQLIVSRSRESVADYECLSINDLECRAIVGINPCERDEAQLVTFGIMLQRSPVSSIPFDFRTLSQRIYSSVTQSEFLTLEALAYSVAKVGLEFAAESCEHVTVRASKPSALACAEAAEVEITRSIKNGSLVLRLPHVSGNPPQSQPNEPSEAQATNSTMPPTTQLTTDQTQSRPTAQTVMADSHSQGMTSSTLPSYAVSRPERYESTSLSELASELSLNENTIKHKAAIAFGSNLGDRFFSIELALRLFETDGIHYSRLAGDAFVNVIDTSFMYETFPMYVVDQPKFINCACMVETNLSAIQLLTLVKRIETIVGRVGSFRNGPRAIDLDILTFDNQFIDTRPLDERTLDNLEGHLVVPHPRLLEREFVLRPLNDMIPGYVIPVTGKTVGELFESLLFTQGPDPQVAHKVVPFPRYPLNRNSPEPDLSLPRLPQVTPVPPTASYWKFPVSSKSTPSPLPRKTYIMGTLNVTPDSFSDGSINNNIPAALSYARSAVAGGADIIDIGGYSTRPGAAYVQPEEELSRVVPIVQAIRTLGQYQVDYAHSDLDTSVEAQARRVLMSVDTFRWEVAEEAIHAGANCINDVYAFSGPGYPTGEMGENYFAKMRQVARDLAVPVILTHSRGEASANKDYSAYGYASDASGKGAVLEGVKVELGRKVDAAVRGKGGLRRWYVIVDPGIGFSKSVDGNLEILRNASDITEDKPSPTGNRGSLAGYPLLIGASRKSFLGGILEQPDPAGTYAGRITKPMERGWATAATVACAVQQNAAVVRVHDVLEMGDVVRTTSAIWGQIV